MLPNDNYINNSNNILYVIDIIKKKAFEPKKAIEKDQYTGLRSLIDAKQFETITAPKDNSNKELENIDGWDLADKEYVERKFKEVESIVTRYISNFGNSILSTKSDNNNSGNKNNNKAPSKSSSLLFSKGELVGDTSVLFFSPALLFKDCEISDIVIVSNKVFQNDYKLNMIENNKDKQNKTTLFTISKIDSTVASGGDSRKIKIDKTKTLSFELEGPVKDNSFMLQFVVEYNH